MAMARGQRTNRLLALLIVNVVVSLVHYTHNMYFLPDYREPDWITPAVIDGLWVVMTPFGCAGYLMYLGNKLTVAYTCLYIYCGLSLLVLGHYLITPIWTLSAAINVIILAEAIVAAILAAYVFNLQDSHESETGV